MKRYLPLIALAASACATTGTATPREGPVALGQTAQVGGIRVRPDTVVEDSRCPADVMCVWAGRLIVRATVIGGNWRKVLDLQLGKPQTVADGQLTLTAAAPARFAKKPPQKPEPYRFTFDFQGGI